MNALAVVRASRHSASLVGPRRSFLRCLSYKGEIAHLDADISNVTDEQVREIDEKYNAMRKKHHSLTTEFPAHRYTISGTPSELNY